MNTPGYVAAVLAKAEAGGARAAEPLADLPRLDELPEPASGQGA